MLKSMGNLNEHTEILLNRLYEECFAKNTLINVHSFLPMQIVFGSQPRIPGAAQDNLPPANETYTENIPVYDRLKAIFEARKLFTEVENQLD